MGRDVACVEDAGEINDSGGRPRKVRWDSETGEVYLEVPGSAGSKYVKVGIAKDTRAALLQALANV
jgi:hypothetical protein